MDNTNSKKTILKAIAILLIIVLCLILLYAGGRWLENRNAKPEVRGDSRLRLQFDDLIETDGKTYRLRKNLTTVLIMGIDKDVEDISSSDNGYGGQADFQRILVIDHNNKEILQIEIDRDTITDIDVLDVLGNPSGTREAQISLAHSFGDGEEESCKLACNAVSNLFLGMPIDLYCAVNMDGIGEINDMVGGITVTLEDDFTSLDPSMEKGSTVTLSGDQAEFYVRGRMSVGIGTNEARMKRQQDYIAKLLEKMQALQNENPNFAENLYDAMTPYMTTNISKGQMTNELSVSQDYERIEPYYIQGQHEIASDGFMQFFVDKDSIKQLVLDIFYEEVY